MEVLCNGRVNSARRPLPGRVLGDLEELLGGGNICSSKEGKAGWAEGTVAA